MVNGEIATISNSGAVQGGPNGVSSSGSVSGWNGYTYSGTSVSTPTLAVPSNLQAWDIVNSNVPSGVSASASGIQTSNFASSIKFSGSSSTPLTSPSYTIDYATENAVESASQTISNTTGVSQNPTENQNWWNSTFSGTFSPPSGWINGGTVDGKAWNTQAAITVRHVLSAGYATGALTDNMQVTGFSSHSFNPPAQKYQSWTDSATLNSQTTFSYSVAEFITYKISGAPNPPNYASIDQSPVNFSISYSSPISISYAVLYIGGQLADRYDAPSSSGSLSYSFTDPSFAPQTVSWYFSTGEYSQYFNLTYGGATSVPENSSSVIVLQSSSATQSYPITLSGVPSGTGYYQQLITISNPSAKGINSAGSNFEITESNGTPLYTWIQSINSTSITAWVKVPYSSTGLETLSLNVMPSFENLLSSTGYLGEAPQLSASYAEYDNGKSVFSLYNDFKNSADYTSQNSTYLVRYADNGLIIISLSNTESVPITDFTYQTGQSVMFLANLSYNSSQGGGTYNILDIINFNTILGANGGGAVSQLNGSRLNLPPKPYSHPQTPYLFEIGSVSGYGSFVSINGTVYQTNSSYLIPSGQIVWDNDIGTGAIIRYVAVRDLPSNNAMPTASISSSGSTYMANATTTSSFQGQPGREYNATFQYDSYLIPIAPTTNYLTVLYNASWTISNLYPSTYKVINSASAVLFTNLTGFTSIQVSFIQPSVLIGSSVSVSLLLEQQGTNQTIGPQYDQEFQPTVTYTPFGGATPISFQPSNLYFNLPYGSTASVSVNDYWQESVGRSSFSVTSSTVQVDVPLNVTYTSFVAKSTGLGLFAVAVRQGSYNLSGLSPLFLKNGSSYEYYTSNLNGTGLISNSFTPTNASYTVSIDIGAPTSNLIVNALAYSGSGIGQLQNGGPSTGSPTANLYINGVKTLFGSSFIGILGDTYNITIDDVLGHTLFQKDLTLSSPVMPETFTVTAPSYVLGFVNNEAVPATSPLAVQSSALNEVGYTSYYNFTTHVNQESELYLTPGTYHLYTHDNLTNSLNITLVNESVFYSFNGQNISQITEKQFNYSILSLSVSVSIAPLTTNQTGNATITLSTITVGGKVLLDEQQTKEALANMTIEIWTNKGFYSSVTPYYISPGRVGVSLNLSKANAYSLNVTTNLIVSGKALSWASDTGFTVTAPPFNIFDFFQSALGQVIFYLGILVTVITVGSYVYRVITRKRRQEKRQEKRIKDDLVAETIYKSMTPQQREAILKDYAKKHSGWLHRNGINLKSGFRKMHQNESQTQGSGKK